MLIAEIGLCHFGSMDAAKSLILAAKESGADAVKSQIIEPALVAKYGSMGEGFYRQCYLSFEQNQELYYFGLSNSIPVFFSYFTSDPRRIGPVVKYSAKQFAETNDVKYLDSKTSIVSVSDNFSIEKVSQLKNANVMFAIDYMLDDPKVIASKLTNIQKLSDVLGRPVGYSDHCVNPEVSRIACRDYNLLCLEKHFFVGDVVSFDGKVFRDTIHASRPAEFEKIAATFKKSQGEASKLLLNRLFPRRVKS